MSTLITADSIQILGVSI